MQERRAMQRFFSGTSLKFTAVADTDNVTAATITLINPANLKIINAASMTQEAARVWTYIWDTSYNGVIEGRYIVTIELTELNHKSVDQDFFALVLTYPGIS